MFHDEIGLERVRERLRWYPHDVWLYLLASGWQRISQEEAFVGRAGEVGDELGARVITARLVRDVVRLAFLMERTFAPYAKWLGTAFAELDCAKRLSPILAEVLVAATWKQSESSLAAGYRELALMHNELGLTPPVSTEPTRYFGRSQVVIHGERLAETLRTAIRDTEVRRIADRGLIGSIDQFSDSTDLAHPVWRGALKGLFED